MKPCQLYVVKKKKKKRNLLTNLIYTLVYSSSVIELKTAVSRIKSD